MKFKCRATTWGCEHEKEAQEAYIVKATKNHIGFKLSSSGLMIHLLCKYKTIKDACGEKSRMGYYMSLNC